MELRDLLSWIWGDQCITSRIKGVQNLLQGGGLIDGAQSYRMHLLYGFTPLRLLLTCSRIQIHSHWLVCKYWINCAQNCHTDKTCGWLQREANTISQFIIQNVLLPIIIANRVKIVVLVKPLLMLLSLVLLPQLPFYYFHYYYYYYYYVLPPMLPVFNWPQLYTVYVYFRERIWETLHRPILGQELYIGPTTSKPRCRSWNNTLLNVQPIPTCCSAGIYYQFKAYSFNCLKHLPFFKFVLQLRITHMSQNWREYWNKVYVMLCYD